MQINCDVIFIIIWHAAYAWLLRRALRHSLTLCLLCCSCVCVCVGVNMNVHVCTSKTHESKCVYRAHETCVHLCECVCVSVSVCVILMLFCYLISIHLFISGLFTVPHASIYLSTSANINNNISLNRFYMLNKLPPFAIHRVLECVYLSYYSRMLTTPPTTTTA